MNGRRHLAAAWIRFCSCGVLLLASGCDWGSPPPARSEADLDRALDKAQAGGPPPTVGVVLPSRDLAEQVAWDRIGRVEASAEKVLFEPIAPEPGKAGEAIRRAVESGGLAALAVYVESPEEAGPAIAEAARRGIPTIALARAPAGGGFPPIPLVSCEDYGKAAQELVAAARKYADELAEMNGFPVEFQAAIAIPEGGEGDPKVSAFESAIKGAEIDPAPPLGYKPGADYRGTRDAVASAMEAACKANPKLRMIFAVDEASLDGLMEGRMRVKKAAGYKVVAAGFTAYIGSEAYADAGKVAAVAQFPVGRVLHEALALAKKAARGEAIPPKTVIPFRIGVVSARDELEPRTGSEFETPPVPPAQ